MTGLWAIGVTCSYSSRPFLCTLVDVYVAVPCRNQRLFCRLFQSHLCLRSAVLLNFLEGRGSYALRRFIRYSCNYEVCMSPTLNGSSAIQRFEHSDAIEIRGGITFVFYTGLPHMNSDNMIKLKPNPPDWWHRPCMTPQLSLQ